MKSKIILITLVLVLIGANLYAAGDLVVNGKLGVGTNPLNPKAAILTTNQRGLSVTAISNTNNTGGIMKGAIYTVTLDGGTSTDSLYGQEATLAMMSDLSGTVPGGTAASYAFQIGTPDTVGTTNVTQVIGLKYLLNRHFANTRTYNVTDSYGFLSFIADGGSDGAAINVTNHYHQYLDDPGVLSKIHITNLYGMYIKKMTAGTNNYGLVLNGDGAGADIVFGPNKEARIYSSGGELFAQDGASNVTQISPHDPVTGEWVFYSKNVKTGRVVKVDMERLVKAVEKLTGETFMVENLMVGQ